MQTVSSSALFSGLPSYFTLSFCVEWSDGYSSGASVVVHIEVENQLHHIWIFENVKGTEGMHLQFYTK